MCLFFRWRFSLLSTDGIRYSFREIFDLTIALKHKKVINDIVKEVAVVTYYNHAPFEGGEILFKDAEGNYVKVVGWLVKYQEVG